MATVLEMPKVAGCTVTACAYNSNGCHAYAITVAEAATCATFIEMPTKGGIDDSGRVGACQQVNCMHNVQLECRAPSIQVGDAMAECQTFEPRR